MLAVALTASPLLCAREIIDADLEGATALGLVPIRPVRVQLARDIQAVRLACNTPCEIRFDGAKLASPESLPDGPVVLQVGQPGSIRIKADNPLCDGLTAFETTFQSPPGGKLRVETSADGMEWSPPAYYAGLLRVSAQQDPAGLSVVNEVDVERYVASVVAHEVWPTFHEQALQAQAVIARSFVIDQMLRRRDEPWDLVASQQAQVYGGLRSDPLGRRALRAALSTRGLVCTWNDGRRERIFPTYYSSACGGRTQSAAIFGPESDIPPLAGGIPCDYCRIAPEGVYRWGPVHIPRDEAYRRLAARHPELASLGGIEGLEVVEREPGGRPTRIAITGPSGETRELSAENFRLAVGSRAMPSTACDITMTPKEIVLENGKGTGHGLGLCQWGMEGQARLGRAAADILRYYYPGVHLTRVY
ncbi:MAG: SpoIID/LytB domain-containing protein [Phycisphaerae bacterium]|nr:SpoIID/LytB domain-containing protein [Phycisphaerae bacterium]